ncbi:hypothetical protein VMCG_05852 [Cytospora schulzeri]|uniref:Uncharacterized protein n=1 Tax=Cytospora schulzeri TaxID=448051 RepID=A0A423WCY8_9PEZI|nr:hypothetical protein VMCG_05852 [Valsa malicola]
MDSNKSFPSRRQRRFNQAFATSGATSPASVFGDTTDLVYGAESDVRHVNLGNLSGGFLVAFLGGVRHIFQQRKELEPLPSVEDVLSRIARAKAHHDAQRLDDDLISLASTQDHAGRSFNDFGMEQMNVFSKQVDRIAEQSDRIAGQLDRNAEHFECSNERIDRKIEKAMDLQRWSMLCIAMAMLGFIYVMVQVAPSLGRGQATEIPLAIAVPERCGRVAASAFSEVAVTEICIWASQLVPKVSS